MRLAGRTLTPMLPVGGELMVELRHKSEMHIGAAVCSAAWGASYLRVRFFGPTAHPLRYTNAASALRGGVKKTRMKNFNLVILLGYAKTNFDPQNGRKDAK